MKAATDALDALSQAFCNRDAEGAVACFADDAAIVYAGSELGEVATGKAELRALLATVFARPEVYSWTPTDVCVFRQDPHLLVFAELVGCSDDGHHAEEFPYRMSGVLRHDEGRGWRWLLFHGAEPTGPIAGA